MTDYRFRAEWMLDATPDRVWDTLLRAREWPEWWHGFESVVQLAPGEESGVGMVLRQRWRGLLPVTLTLDLEILRVEQRRLLRARASGDMTGTCTWTLRRQDGGTNVEFELDARPTKRWMRSPGPLTWRIVEWNARSIMRRGGEGLARRLAASAGDRTAQPAPAGA